MKRWKFGFSLCAGLACSTGSPAVFADPLNQQQIQLIRETASSICNTVNDMKGERSNLALQGDIKAQLGGLASKFVDVGGTGKGSITREEFEGLSRDAIATAFEGDRGCRERVFDKMFDKLTAVAAGPSEPAPVVVPHSAHSAPAPVNPSFTSTYVLSDNQIKDLAESVFFVKSTLPKTLIVQGMMYDFQSKGLLYQLSLGFTRAGISPIVGWDRPLTPRDTGISIRVADSGAPPDSARKMADILSKITGVSIPVMTVSGIDRNSFIIFVGPKPNS